MRNNSRDGNIISDKYQTDAEPAEQEAFDEMLNRRNRLDKAGAVQAPAVPGDSHSQQIMMSQQNNLVRSPQPNSGHHS